MRRRQSAPPTHTKTAPRLHKGSLSNEARRKWSVEHWPVEPAGGAEPQETTSSPPLAGARRQSVVPERKSQAQAGAGDEPDEHQLDKDQAQRRKSVASQRPATDKPSELGRERALVRQGGSESAQPQAPLGDDQVTSKHAAGVSQQESAASESADSAARSNATSDRHQQEQTSDGSACRSKGQQHEHEPETEHQRHRRRRSRHRPSDDWPCHHHEPAADADEQPDGAPGGAPSEDERRQARRRASRSQPPMVHRRQHRLVRAPSQSNEQQHQRAPAPLRSAAATSAIELARAPSVSPSLASNVNIRHILENVAHAEGPFPEPQLALKVAMDALESACWSTKVEGLLALIRLASFHEQVVSGHLHEIVCKTAAETRNLRSTVARSAIFALGAYCTSLRRIIEPELDIIVQCLLQKSSENTSFIREDIRRALTQLADNLTQWRVAISLINHGANHKNLHVRRMSSQFVAQLVERMGAARCLVGARDISAQVIPAAVKFAQDSSPHTRYYGRLILARLMQHGAFERLLRRNLAPNLYRNSLGLVESVRRRGPGEPPADG